MLLDIGTTLLKSFRIASNNTASGLFSSVGGGEQNTASGESSSVSGGNNRTAPATDNWAAGALFSDH